MKAFLILLSCAFMSLQAQSHYEFESDLREGNIEAVKQWFSRGGNLKKITEFTPLIIAATNGHGEVCKYLLSKGARLRDTSAYYGKTVLHAAAQGNLLWLAKECVPTGISVNITDAAGLTPLHYACAAGNIEIASWLISRGANVNAVSTREHYDPSVHAKATPLHVAVGWNHLTLSRWLIEKGAQVNAADEDDLTPLHFAISDSMVSLLTDHGANINAVTKDMDTPLTVAIKKKNIALFLCLLEKGAQFSDTTGNQGTSRALSAVCEVRNVDKSTRTIMIKELVSRGAPVGENADVLASVIKFNLWDPARLLIDKGASPNIEFYISQSHTTPLKEAMKMHDTALVKFMIGKGADPAFSDPSAWVQADSVMTEIFLRSGFLPDSISFKKAITDGNYSNVARYIRTGAKLNVKYSDGLTALDYAAKGDANIYELLKKNGARSSMSDTLIQWFEAVKKQDISTARRLLKMGVDVNARNLDQSSALPWAIYNRNRQMTDLIIKAGAKFDREEYGPWSAEYEGFNLPYVLAAGRGDLKTVQLIEKSSPGIGDEKISVKLLGPSCTKRWLAIQAAVLFGPYPNVIDHLTKSAYEIDGTVDDGVRLLHSAAMVGDVRSAEIFLKAGAQVNLGTNDEKTALDLAQDNLNPVTKKPVNKTPLVKLLLKYGAKTGSEIYALFRAIEKADTLAVRRSIEQGASMTTLKGANLPINLAIEKRVISVIKILLEKGASPDVEDPYYGYLLHASVLSDDKDLLGLLLDFNAKTEVENSEGQTALHLAAGASHPVGNSAFTVMEEGKARYELARMLIAKGADVNHKDKRGKTPLDYVNESNKKMIELLKSRN